jgi:hypothetical protein
MTLGDLAGVMLIFGPGLVVLGLLAVCLRRRRRVEYVPATYVLSQPARPSQTAVRRACEDSARRSRARR